MSFYPVAPLPDTNARQVAQTIRQPSTALLTIDSEDRYTDFVQSRAFPTSPYNFTIRKNESMMAGFMTRIGISEINFPWSIPNINVKTQTIGITYNDASGTVTNAFNVTPGFYTPADLAAFIQTFIQTNTPLTAFTMTYGAGPLYGAEPLFEYSTNTAATVAFFPLPYNSAAYPFSSQTKQLFDLLGFTNVNTTLSTASNGVYTLCQAIRYVDIVCNQLMASAAQKDQTSQTVVRDMLCRIYLGDGAGTGQSTVSPVDSTFSPPGCAPTTIYRNFTTPKQIQWIPNQNIPGYLTFQVYDDTGDLLDNSIYNLAPGQLSLTSQTLDWSMTMLVSEN